MKRSSMALLSLLFLALQAYFILSVAQTFGSDPVLDTSGAELLQGVSYHIFPADSAEGGGVTLNTSSCPFEIVENSEDGSELVPVRFSTVTNDSVIRVGADTNIMFLRTITGLTAPVFCLPSPVWRVNEAGSGPVFVTIGGVEGEPGDLPNWFTIGKYEDAYILQHCPSDDYSEDPSQDIIVICRNIGVFVENGRSRLALDQPPLKVVFQRR